MAFIISLDFELMWGMRDKKTVGSYGANILGVREAIPAMLRLFTQYQVKASWATVGLLLARTKSELRESLPQVRPTYANPALSPYESGYLDQLGRDEKSDPYHYGYSLAARIVDTPGMELASHTFSHYYCLESGQTAEQFRSDLQASVAACAGLGTRPTSIVFPRNQFNPEYLAICSEVGLRSYRGNESTWMHQAASGKEPTLKRLARLADHYASLSGPNTFRTEREPTTQMMNVPSSRFLRPYSRKLAAFEPLRMKRINDAMTAAAKTGEHFHLWWHPHNFGANTMLNLQNLESVLQHYARLRDQHEFQSHTMGEMASL